MVEIYYDSPENFSSILGEDFSWVDKPEYVRKGLIFSPNNREEDTLGKQEIYTIVL